MRMEQKQTRKEDGRRLIYYHFPATATSEESAVFAAINPVDLLKDDPRTEATLALAEGSVSGTAQASEGNMPGVYTPPSDAPKGGVDV